MEVYGPGQNVKMRYGEHIKKSHLREKKKGLWKKKNRKRGAKTIAQ